MLMPVLRPVSREAARALGPRDNPDRSAVAANATLAPRMRLPECGGQAANSEFINLNVHLIPKQPPK